MRTRSVLGLWKKNILDYLHMGKMSARWITRLLTPFKKKERGGVSKTTLILCRDNQEDVLMRLITHNETSGDKSSVEPMATV